MTQQRWKSFLAPLAITAASVLSFTACSGHDDEEQVAPDSANNDANDEKADAPNEEAASETAGEAKAAADSTSESAAGGEASAAAAAEAPAADAGDAAAAAPASDTVASSEAAAPAAVAAGGGAAPAPAASATAPGLATTPVPAGGAAPGQASAGRVVRYIQVDQTGLHAQASEASPVTMRLAQGDILMVLEENGWGRVTDQLFVKLDAVSNRAVPRLFERPEWQAPAH